MPVNLLLHTLHWQRLLVLLLLLLLLWRAGINAYFAYTVVGYLGTGKVRASPRAVILSPSGAFTVCCTIVQPCKHSSTLQGSSAGLTQPSAACVCNYLSPFQLQVLLLLFDSLSCPSTPHPNPDHLSGGPGSSVCGGVDFHCHQSHGGSWAHGQPGAKVPHAGNGRWHRAVPGIVSVFFFLRRQGACRSRRGERQTESVRPAHTALYSDSSSSTTRSILPRPESENSQSVNNP